MPSLTVEGVIGRLHYANALVKFSREWGGVCPQQAADNLDHVQRILKESMKVLRKES